MKLLPWALLYWYHEKIIHTQLGSMPAAKLYPCKDFLLVESMTMQPKPHLVRLPLQWFFSEGCMEHVPNLQDETWSQDMT